ncbi:hypothetical protein BGZ76_008462, partial [Entomortierella beljakovae]
MPRAKKQSRHLRSIAVQRLKPITPTFNQELQDEDVIYVPVREGYKILGSSCDREEWDAILAEPDSDGPVETDTDEEDWQEVRRSLGKNEDWSEVLKIMQLAAADAKPIKPRDGNSRQNLHHRKMALKKAAVGTPPLSTFGFTASAPSAPRKVIQEANSL